MARLFVLHHDTDRKLVSQLADTLNAEDHAAWYTRNFPGGVDWWLKICKRIAHCDAVIYVLSREAIQANYTRAVLKEAQRWNRPVVMIASDSETPIPMDVQGSTVDFSDGITEDSVYELSKTIHRSQQERPAKPLWNQITAPPHIGEDNARSSGQGRRRGSPALYTAVGILAIFFIALFLIVQATQTGSGTVAAETANPQSTTVAGSNSGVISPTQANDNTRPSASATPQTTISPTQNSSGDNQSTAIPTDERTVSSLPEAPDDTATPIDDENVIRAEDTVMRIELPDEAFAVLQPGSAFLIDYAVASEPISLSLLSGEIYVDSGNSPAVVLHAPDQNIEIQINEGRFALEMQTLPHLRCFSGECSVSVVVENETIDLEYTAGQEIILNLLLEDIRNAPVLPIRYDDLAVYDVRCDGCIDSSLLERVVAVISNPQPVNLRLGPGTGFAIAAVARTGEQFTVSGVNEDASWLQLQTDAGEPVWIASFLVAVEGDLETLEVVES